MCGSEARSASRTIKYRITAKYCESGGDWGGVGGGEELGRGRLQAMEIGEGERVGWGGGELGTGEGE